MRHKHEESLTVLCGLFGKTRQAWYDMTWYKDEETLEQALVLEMVAAFRKHMPKIGTRKLYYLLQEPMQQHNIKMGRDKLFDLLADHGWLIKKRRSYRRTTISNHYYKRYANLIRGLILTAPDQLWVSDITYITVERGFNYLSLITDAYSRKIIGYCLSTRLDNAGCLAALQMALHSRQNRSQRLIHHSDRGIQYCSGEYVEMLHSEGIFISMTENGDPYENAIAERINGILKTEFSLEKTFKNFTHAKAAIAESIRVYNEMRPHASCDYLTPQAAHEQEGILPKKWKPKERKAGKPQLSTY